jgi:serine/threonine-protein kinase
VAPIPLNDRLTAALSDRYRLERELGAGGMATVYLAHDLKHERDVAIKVLHPDLGAALGADRFLAEIKTTAKLQHPHILPLLDSGAADGLLYYVMPLLDGETLRAYIARSGQLPVNDAVRITTGIAQALVQCGHLLGSRGFEGGAHTQVGRLQTGTRLQIHGGRALACGIEDGD